MDFVKREDHGASADAQYKAYIESIQKSQNTMEAEYHHTPMTIEQLHQLQSSLSSSPIVHNFQLPLSPRQMSTLMFRTNHLTRNDLPISRSLTDIDIQNLQNLNHDFGRPEDLVLTQNLNRNLDLARNLSMDLELQNNLAQSLIQNVTEQELAKTMNSNLNRINDVLPQNLSHDVDLSHLNRQISDEILGQNERRTPLIINNINIQESIHEQSVNQRLEQNLAQRLEQNLTQRMEQNLTQRMEQNLTQRMEQNLTQRLEQNFNQRMDPTLVQRLMSQQMNLHEIQRQIDQNDHLLPMPFHIKAEQEDEGYFYDSISHNINVNGLNGHIPVSSEPPVPPPAVHPQQDTQMYVYPQNNHTIPALNPLDLYSRPQNYIQNYNRENPENLVVQRQFNNNSPYHDDFKKYRQDGGEENVAKQKEQPKENLKPNNENKIIFYADFNGQTVNQNNEKTESVGSNENKSVSDDISLIKGEYICYKCNEVFPSKRGLKQHTKTCSEGAETETDTEKTGKFSCSQCAYRCQSPAILKIHERVHSGEKPFSCTFCSYKSGQKNNVAKHMLVHMNQKPFRCQYCEYRCAQKNNLVVHERTHTGFKPFACPYCDYRTVQKPNLVKHMYLHTDQKPFSCDQCSYRCVQKTNLTKHKQRHLNERGNFDIKNPPKPYRPRQKSVKCPYCPYKCVQKSSLDKHLLFKHPDQSLPDDFNPNSKKSQFSDDFDPNCNKSQLPDDFDPNCNKNQLPDDFDPICNKREMPDDYDSSRNESQMLIAYDLNCKKNQLPNDFDSDCNKSQLPNDFDSNCNKNQLPNDFDSICNKSQLPHDYDPNYNNSHSSEDYDSNSQNGELIQNLSVRKDENEFVHASTIKMNTCVPVDPIA